MKVGEMHIAAPTKTIIEGELLNTLEVINERLKYLTSDEEGAILLNAKVNALLALQKYE